jgi:hypothetical protein
MKDESGKPIFIIQQEPYLEFFPYDIVTINEYIKAKQEKAEESSNKSGAV